MFLPDYQVGFELNGYYWHHCGLPPKPQDYHKNKTTKALEVGIKLYHIWESTSLGLTKSIALSKVGLLPIRAQARKCTVVEEKGDLANWHVDGDCRSIKAFSLLYNERLIATLTLRKHQEGLEIARFACERGTQVLGGYQKPLKAAKDYAVSQGYSTLITYCNRDLSPDPTNNIYTRMGFTLVKECPPHPQVLCNQ